MIQLSIITINFNNREGLERTFHSVFSRIKEGIEYIVIDAESDDGSQELIHSHKNKIDQVLIEKDKGIYDGMNKGVSLAQGRYVIFINSGDLLLQDDLLSILSERDEEVIYGNTKIHYSNGFERIGKAQPISELWKSLPFVHQSVLVKRENLKKNKFNLDFKYCSDYELICRIHSQNASFKMIDEIIAQIEAGGVSDEKRDEATKEVYAVSSRYHNLSEKQKAWFENEIKKAKRVRKLKKYLPNSLIKFALKLKYRK